MTTDKAKSRFNGHSQTVYQQMLQKRDGTGSPQAIHTSPLANTTRHLQVNIGSAQGIGKQYQQNLTGAPGASDTFLLAPNSGKDQATDFTPFSDNGATT